MKTFNEAVKESTCQKRVTVCEIYDKLGNLLSRESNRCNPDNGVCSRLGVVNTKSNYPSIGCNWTHAEINAIDNLEVYHEPYKAILYGHDFLCDDCENALKAVGVLELEIISKLP